MTVKLWSIMPRDTDWPITAHCMQKSTFRNRTRSISESWLFTSKNWCKCVCHIWKFSFKSCFQKKTFRCAVGYNGTSAQLRSTEPFMTDVLKEKYYN